MDMKNNHIHNHKEHQPKAIRMTFPIYELMDLKVLDIPMTPERESLIIEFIESIESTIK